MIGGSRDGAASAPDLRPADFARSRTTVRAGAGSPRVDDGPVPGGAAGRLRGRRGEDAEVVARRVVQVGEDQPVLAGGGRYQHLPAEPLDLGADGGHVRDHYHEDRVVGEFAAGVEDPATGRIR